MTDIVNNAEIRVTADASGVEAGLRPAVDAANRVSQSVRQTGANSASAARTVEASQRNIIAAIQRTTMAMESGGRTTAAFYEAQARARNVDPTSLTPYLNQLRAVETAQTQAAESARTQAAAARELAQAQSNKESFLAGLREQVALFGRSTEEVLRYRAAQAGASQESAHLILQLQHMRAAQEQVEASARAAALAQREAAQADASRNNFLAGLREQIALFGLSTEEVHRYRAAQLGAAQSADPLIAQLRDLRLAQEQAAYGARMEAQAQREAAQARAGRESFLKGLEQQASAIGKTRVEYLELQAAQMGVTAQARPFIEQLRAAEQGMRNNGMSAAQMNAALRGVPAQMTDIIVSLQGGQAPLTVLFQQGGQLRDMFGSVGGAARALGGAVLGLINPYTILAGTVAVGVAAFKAGHDESIKYSRALALTNNIAGTTSEQMADMARNIGAVSGSQREGAKALTTLASTGAITRQNLEWFGTVAVDAQHVLGKSVEDTAKEFAELGKSPLTALQSINEKYHFITAATYAQVKAAQEQGRTIEAVNIAQLAYAEGISKQRQNVLDSLTDWERGWLRIKKAISESVDGVIDFATGREGGPEEKIKGLLEQRTAMEERVARLKRVGANRDGDKYDPSKDRDVLVAQAQVDANLREINSIREKAAAKKGVADASAAETRADELRNKWLGERNIILTRGEQLTRDLDAAETEGRQNNLKDAEIQDRLMVIRRKYNDVYVAGIDQSITALRRRGELENSMSQRAVAQIEAQRGAGLITEEEAIRRTAAKELEEIDRRKASLQAELGLVGKKISSRRDQLDLEGQIAKIADERVGRGERLEADLAAAQRKRGEASEELYLKGIQGAEAELKSMMDLVDAQILSNAEIGLGKVEVADMAAKRLLSAAALKEEAAASQAALPGGQRLAEIYRQQAAELRSLAAAKQTGAAKDDANEAGRKALEEMNKFLDPSRAQTFGEALREAFGSSGDALSKLMANLDGYGKREAEIIKHRETAEKNRGTKGFDEAAYLKTVTELGEREIKNRLQGYGDMASAAKGFFSEGSKGYQALESAERAFRIMELASQMESLYTHLFVTTSKGAATVAGQTVETGAVVAGEAVRNTAKVPGVFMSFMSSMGPYGMAAAGVAIAAVLGGAFSGGGGSVNIAEQRQKSQGAGTVFGDSDAKSESISKALGLIEDHTFQGLTVSMDMLTALTDIRNSIGSFAKLVVRDTDIRGTSLQFAGMDGSDSNFFSKLGNSIFGGKKTLEDSGFTMNATTLAAIAGGGLNAMSYADIKKSGGWFSSDKYSTTTAGLGEAGNKQIADVILKLTEGVKVAAATFGLTGDDFTSKLNSFVVDIGKISFKGMKADEIEAELQAVFSKLGDQIAESAMGGLGQFQQVGEGYLETLTRIAAGYQTVTVVADSLGMAFDSVGVGSIEARQRLIDLAGGLDAFKESADSFMSDFYTDKERADALRVRIQPTLDQFGIQTGADDSMEQFRDVVKSLKLETAEGAQAFATLMQIAPAFKQIADVDAAKFEERIDLQQQLDQLTMSSAQLLGKQRDALDESNRALFDQVQAATRFNAIRDERKGLQEEYDQLTMSSAELLAKQRDALDESNRALFDQIQGTKAAAEAQRNATQAAKDHAANLLSGLDGAFSVLQTVVGREKALLQEVTGKHQALASALRGTLDSMNVSGNEREDRLGAQAQIRAALAIAKASGVLPDADSLKGALSVIGKDSSALFATQQDYLRDFYSTQNDIADLAGLTDKTLSVEEQSIKRLDDILSNAQQELNALKGIDMSVFSLAEAIRGWEVSLGAAKADSVASAGGSIAGLYKELLGRPADSAGLDYWKDAVAGGVSLDQVRKMIMEGVEYKGLRGFAVGTNFVPTNMPAMIHEGERIIPAADNRELMRRLASPNEGNAALVGEVRRLAGIVEKQQQALDRIAGSTGQLAEQFDEVSEGGNAMRTDVINVVQTKGVA